MGKVKQKLYTEHVLSVQQPHASLLVTGSDIPNKWCENRSWKPGKLTPSKLKSDRGLPRILIHASSKYDYEFEPSYPLIPEYMTRSAIVGSVRLLGVYRVSPKTKPKAVESLAISQYCSLKNAIGEVAVFEDVEAGLEHVGYPPSGCKSELYWWFFDKPVQFGDPIPSKGALNIWRYQA